MKILQLLAATFVLGFAVLSESQSLLQIRSRLSPGSQNQDVSLPNAPNLSPRGRPEGKGKDRDSQPSYNSGINRLRPQVEAKMSKQKKDQMKETLEDPKKIEKFLDDLSEGKVIESLPKGWYHFDSDEDVPLGKTGIQFKDLKDENGNVQKYAFIFYGDDLMVRHASHVEYHEKAFPWAKGMGYRKRRPEEMITRADTVDKEEYESLTVSGTVKDENPPMKWFYSEGVFTIMKVSKPESDHQGLLIRLAKDGTDEHGIIAHFDNRKDPKPEHTGIILRGPEVDGYDKPQDVLPPMTDKEKEQARSFLMPIPQELLPAHLRSGDTHMSNTRSPEKRDANTEWIVHAPLYNLQMQGDDIYNLPNLAQWSARTSPISARDLMGNLENQQLNANDSSTVKDQDDIAMMLIMQEELKLNATRLILPFIDAVMNGSSSGYAEAQAWALYSMISPPVSTFGPFMGGRDNFDFWNITGRARANSDVTGRFNSFVYDRATQAVNQTNILGLLDKINLLLATYEIELFPDQYTALDGHDTEPMIDYLRQWYEYNGVPFTPDDKNSGAGWHTPEWVWDILDITVLEAEQDTDNSTGLNSSDINNPSPSRRWNVKVRGHGDETMWHD